MSSLHKIINLGNKFKKKFEELEYKGPEETFLAANMLYSDILEKAESIQALTSNNHSKGASSILRSIFENYIYIKYIFERNKYVNDRAEAYYLRTKLEFPKILNVINSTEKKGEIVRKHLNIYAIEPVVSKGTIDDQIKRYNTLTEGNMKNLDSNIQAFYSKPIGNKKYTKFPLLCEYLGETYMYEIYYKILSLEVHGKSEDLFKNGVWDEWIENQCEGIVYDSTKKLSKYFELRSELETLESYIL